MKAETRLALDLVRVENRPKPAKDGRWLVVTAPKRAWPALVREAEAYVGGAKKAATRSAASPSRRRSRGSP